MGVVADLGQQVGRRWLALVGVVSSFVSIIGFGVSQARWWAVIAIVGLVLLVVALFWTLLDLHKELRRDRPNPRESLRSWIEAARLRFDHLSKTDCHSFQWLQQWQDLQVSTYERLNAALGPQEAADFAACPTHPGPVNLCKDAEAQAEYLRSLLERLENLPLMGDWNVSVS